MFPVSNYKGILEQEMMNQRKQIVIMLLVKPSDDGADMIINKFNYLHHKSEKFCSIYAIGYSKNLYIDGVQADKEIDGVEGNKWYYSDKCFIQFQEDLEKRLIWRYSGDPELIILQSDPESHVYLTFSNAVKLDINHAIKQGYIQSFPRFMENLIRASRKHVTARAASKASKLFSIKDTVLNALMESDKLPKPAKRIIKDVQFYRACNSKAVT